MNELNLAGTQQLETGRLVLRRFTPEDAPAMFENWAGDEEAARYLSWNAHASIGVTNKVLERIIAEYGSGETFTWAIVLKQTGQLIGTISLINVSAPDARAETGYCIGKKWWRMGLAAEALRAVLKYAFETVGFNRVEAYHHESNAASGAVMRKAGMVREGCLRQWKCLKGEFADYACYSILGEEYFKKTGE